MSNFTNPYAQGTGNSKLFRIPSILTLKNGSLVEAGTFSQLMEKKGYFYSLFTVSQ